MNCVGTINVIYVAFYISSEFRLSLRPFLFFLTATCPEVNSIDLPCDLTERWSGDNSLRRDNQVRCKLERIRILYYIPLSHVSFSCMIQSFNRFITHLCPCMTPLQQLFKLHVKVTETVILVCTDVNSNNSLNVAALSPYTNYQPPGPIPSSGLQRPQPLIH